MRKTIVMVFALLMVSALFGCAKVASEAPALESGFGSSIEQDLTDLDSLDEDFDLSELDSIDQDLADIDSLFG